MKANPDEAVKQTTHGCLYPIHVGDLRMVCGSTTEAPGAPFCPYHADRARAGAQPAVARHDR